MNRNNRLSLNDALDHSLNAESDYEEFGDETVNNLEVEHESNINSDDNESIIESSDEDGPSANTAAQTVIDFENNAESSDDELLTRKITKDPIPSTTLENVHNSSWRKNDIGHVNTNFQELEVYSVPDPDKTRYEYFKYFVTGEMLDAITEQTNIYSLQSASCSPITTSRQEITRL